MQARLSDLRPILNSIGNFLVRQSQRAFLEQAFDGKPWLRPYRGRRLNIPGIIHDLEASPFVHSYNLVPRNALMASGKLFRSINKGNLQVTSNSVTLDPHVAYAGLHQDGGVTVQAITKTVKRNLHTFLRTHPQFEPDLKFLYKKDTLETKVAKRPFLGVQERDRPTIEKMVEFYVAKGLI